MKVIKEVDGNNKSTKDSTNPAETKDPTRIRRNRGSSEPKFEDFKASFPTEMLDLEDSPNNITGRMINLISPIGKGQRCLIVSPPKAGKTTVITSIINSIENNHPEVTVLVLLVDERPEEIDDMEMSISSEIISSSFDRPAKEHVEAAERTLQRAKKLVEQGKDVVIVLDSITRLARACNQIGSSEQLDSGGISFEALRPVKQFFGAARNVKGGGSLTIIATALKDTNAKGDDVIFQEFKGTGNMELHLDSETAKAKVFPAFDVENSGTRKEEILYDPLQYKVICRLRRVMNKIDGDVPNSLEALYGKLLRYETNERFLKELSKGM